MAETHESRLLRAALGLPLLGIFFAAPRIFDGYHAVPMLKAALEQPAITVGSGRVPIRSSFYGSLYRGLAALDKPITFINQFFLPAVYGLDPVARAHFISFGADLSVLMAVWSIESARPANRRSVLQFPIIFLILGQLRGIGWFAPLYFYLHLLSSPQAAELSPKRTTARNLVLSTLPAVLLAHVGPLAATFFDRDLPSRQAWLFVWQIFPVTLSLSRWVLSRSFDRPATSASDSSPKAAPKNDDMTAIRSTILPLVGISAATWLFTLFGRWPGRNGLDVLLGVFVPKMWPSDTADLAGFAREFLRFDEIMTFGAGMLWLGYLFRDLKRVGKLKESWLTVGLRAAAVSVALGPGAAFGLGWLWREEALAR